ncbi:MAG: hypothetical protein QF913_04110, partial [Nitrospinaceae bacterium]|nr:hypothetical protein [Nitrospinaceae bacterium]
MCIQEALFWPKYQKTIEKQREIVHYIEQVRFRQFLELRKNTGAEEFRARDLFYALWIPDLFMQRVEEDADWTL